MLIKLYQDFICFDVSACKRKDDASTIHTEHSSAPKKPRLVFTDLQRRTLQAIFKVKLGNF
jgi:nuclear factor 6 (one cut domain family protein 1)